MDPTPRRLGVACPEACSFHPDRIGSKNAAALAVVRGNGAGWKVFSRRAAELMGRPVASSSVHRHFKHYVEAADPAEPEVDRAKPSDVSILDSIIASGYRNSKNWKPSIRDTLEAMKLKAAMTGQSAFEDMLDAMNDALDLEDDEEEVDESAPENPDALRAPDEAVPETGGDLGEPLTGD